MEWYVAKLASRGLAKRCSPRPFFMPMQDRPDLVEKAIAGTDLEFFRRAGFEF